MVDLCSIFRGLKHLRRALLHTSVFLLAAPHMAYAQSHHDALPYFSIETIILFAMDESTKVKIAAEKEQQANFAVDEAKAILRPDIRLTAEVGREYQNPAGSNDPDFSGGSDLNNFIDASLTLRQIIFNRTKTLEIDRRNHLSAAKALEGEIVQGDVIESTINAYISVLEAQKTLSAAATMFDSISSLVKIIEAAYDAGGETKAKYDFALARLSMAESQTNKAAAAYQDALNNLENLTGRMPDFLATDPDALLINDYDMDFYSALAKKKNEELALINANIRASEADHAKQEATFLPTLDFVIDTSQSHDKGGEVGRVRNVSASMQLTYDLYRGGRREAGANRLASKVRELEYEKEDLIKDITSQVQAKYNDINASRNKIGIKATEMQSYLSIRDIARESELIGEFDAFQSIENEESLYATVVDIYKTEASIYKESYALLKLVGALKKEKFCESC